MGSRPFLAALAKCLSCGSLFFFFLGGMLGLLSWDKYSD